MNECVALAALHITQGLAAGREFEKLKFNNIMKINRITTAEIMNVSPTCGKPTVVGSTVILGDCLAGMKEYPDKHFDLAIVDPPYGLGKRLVDGGSVSPFIKSQNKKVKEWDNTIPTDEYFLELKRVSKNQIIWGGNYFNILPCRCFIVWDKTIHGNTYADADLAWTSFDTPARIYKENIAITTSEGRIHPTQKSIKMYSWLLHKYAKPNDLILDTHLGSGSSRIAADKAGLDFTGFEIDKEYFDLSEKRFKIYKSQLRIEGW